MREAFFLLFLLLISTNVQAGIIAFYASPDEGFSPLTVYAECRITGDDNTSLIIVDSGDGSTRTCSCKTGHVCSCSLEHTYTTGGDKNFSCEYKSETKTQTIHVNTPECSVQHLSIASLYSLSFVPGKNKTINISLSTECTGSVDLSSFFVETPYTLNSNNCSTLSPGGSCTIKITAPDEETTGIMTVATDKGSLTIALNTTPPLTLDSPELISSKIINPSDNDTVTVLVDIPCWTLDFKDFYKAILYFDRNTSLWKLWHFGPTTLDMPHCATVDETGAITGYAKSWPEWSGSIPTIVNAASDSEIRNITITGYDSDKNAWSILDVGTTFTPPTPPVDTYTPGPCNFPPSPSILDSHVTNSTSAVHTFYMGCACWTASDVNEDPSTFESNAPDGLKCITGIRFRYVKQTTFEGFVLDPIVSSTGNLDYWDSIKRQLQDKGILDNGDTLQKVCSRVYKDASGRLHVDVPYIELRDGYDDDLKNYCWKATLDVNATPPGFSYDYYFPVVDGNHTSPLP